MKKTALGRFRHECAEVHINRDGRVVIYSGDDATFEYVYRYVSTAKYVPGDKAANAKLLVRGHALRRALRAQRHADLVAARAWHGSTDGRRTGSRARPTC